MKLTARSVGDYRVALTSGTHTFTADEPIPVGTDAGPDPYALLLGSLAACKVMTAHMYAERKGWPLESVELALDIQCIHARDCEVCESDPDAKINLIEGQIAFHGDLTAEQRERLREIADKCPVHRTLTSETVIHTELIEDV